jgi:hypothetical protein
VAEEGIEVHFDPGRGELSLSCGDKAFAQVRDAVMAAAGLGDAGIDRVPAGVRSIVVERVPPCRSLGFGGRLAVLGCATVGAAVVIALAVGVRTIASWGR